MLLLKNTNPHAHLEQCPCPPTIRSSLHSMTALSRDQNRGTLPRVSLTAVAVLEQRFWGARMGDGDLLKGNSPQRRQLERLVCNQSSKPILKELSLQRDFVVSNVTHIPGTPLHKRPQQRLTAKNDHLQILMETASFPLPPTVPLTPQHPSVGSLYDLNFPAFSLLSIIPR